jgi:hypothetical protein
MSFISNLFKAPELPKMPQIPQVPKIGDFAQEAIGRAQRQRMTNRFGAEDTILASGAKGLGVAPSTPTSSAGAPVGPGSSTNQRSGFATLLGSGGRG